jgi:hypothetical protein
VPGRIFGPKRKEVTGGCRNLRNEEFHYLYASPNIISVIESNTMKWAGHLASLGEMRNSYKNLKRRNHLEDLGVDGKITLNMVGA